jgi:hypothetical protein
MPDRITVHGKQIKLDGEHLADAVSEEAADVIATCLNRAGLPRHAWFRDEQERVGEFFA